MKKNGIRILVAALIILISANVAFTILAARANHAVARAYTERLELLSAIYETRLAFASFTRLMRQYSVSGGDFLILYLSELNRNRYGQARDVFFTYATESELEFFEYIYAHKIEAPHAYADVFRLRREGYIYEAIALAHGPETIRAGMPTETMRNELYDIVVERTQKTIYIAGNRAEIFTIFSGAASLALILVGIIGLVWLGKARISGRVEILAVAFFVIILVNIFFIIAADFAVRDKMDANNQQHALILASYNAEHASEALTRLSRMYNVTGGEAQFNMYLHHLEEDRFGQSLSTFIRMNAADCEINVFVDVLSRFTALRHIESMSMPMRTAGDVYGAMELAFGPEVLAIGRPTNILNEEVRILVSARTQEMVYTAARSHNARTLFAIISAVLLAIVSLGGLVIVSRPQRDTTSGVIVRTLYRISHTTIRTKLLASFAIVIIIFTAQVGVSAYFNMQIERLNLYNTGYLAMRSEFIWAYHLEFSEMRRLLRETVLSPGWLETADENAWYRAEQRLSTSHTQLAYIAQAYKNSVWTDPLFPVGPYDSRIVMMTEIMAHVDTIFMTGIMDIANITDYTGAAETMLQMLRQMATTRQGTAHARIANYRDTSSVVTIVSLILALIFAMFMAFSMLKSFTGRIKAIENTVDIVAQGDFMAGLQGGDDEISAAFTRLASVFSGLISKINDVTDENKKGNLNARIDPSQFKGSYKETALAINNLLDTTAEMLEQKEQLQIARKASEAKSKFLAKMSHEIRTPITAVLGVSEIQLQNPNLPLNMEEAFAQIFVSGNTLLSIVNDILDLSRIEADKMEIINDTYETASLIGDTLQMNLIHMGSKPLEFIIDVDENIPSWLIGDALRIKQVMGNLLSNAFKYTDKGSVTLKIFPESNNQDNRVNLVIVIRDTGRGMNEQQLKILFDEYTRFHMEEARFEEGTGLGMSIALNLLQLMDGKIKVDSKVGKGTTITATLPQQVDNTDVLGADTVNNLKNFNTKTRSAKRLSFAPEPMPYGRALVVDDVDANIYVAKGLLGLYQLHVDSCTSGWEAIEIIKNGETYDIIFLDQMMPELNGMETAQILREMGYNKPIVALTANALVGQAEIFLENGFDGFLSKPIQTVHLNSVLHKFVKNSSVLDGSQNDIEGYFEAFAKESGMHEELCRNFARGQKNAITDLNAAISANNLETAHRIAHTLKGLAGLIKETNLANIAKEAESALRQNQLTPTNTLAALGLEMERVLAEIEKQYPPKNADGINTHLDKSAIKEIFEKTAQLLQEGDFEAINMCDELAKIPQTGDLITQIMDIEFELALSTLAELKEIYVI